MRVTKRVIPSLWAAVVVLIAALPPACGGSPSAPDSEGPAPGGLPPLTPLQTAITGHYERLFGERVIRPALYDNVVNCGGSHVTTTAYLRQPDRRSRLLQLYVSSDGSMVTRSSSTTVVTPAGPFRVLIALVNYSQTVPADVLGSLQAAQTQISADHISFAAARGYGAPIVTFDNTNVLVDPANVENPRSLSGILTALQRQGTNTAGYDFVVSINIEPSRSEGGFATPGSTPGFIYMGNFGNWNAPLSASQVSSVVRAVYHHEIAHHWGWPGTRDWSCSAASNFITQPVLLGWEDVDGDGTPEILDQTPYGR